MGQLLASKSHNILNLRNKTTLFLSIFLISIHAKSIPTHEIFAPPHTSSNLDQILLSDRLWMPILYLTKLG